MSYGDGDTYRAVNAVIAVDPDLVLSVQNFYPAPLAEPFVRFASELNAQLFRATPLASPSWKTALSLCIDCFRGSVRFAALVSAAALARQASEGKGPLSDALHGSIKDLRDTEKDNDGRWWGLLRESLRLLQDGEDYTSVLARKYWKRTRAGEEKTDLHKRVDRAIETRNDVIHDKIDPATYGVRLAELVPHLDRWYRALDFFKVQWLITPVQYNGEEVELELRCGDHRHYSRRSLKCALRLEPGKLYLMDVSGANAILEESPPLLVHPFVVLGDVTGGDTREVLVFRARTPKGIVFGSTLREDVEADFLDAIKPLLPTQGGLALMPPTAFNLVKGPADRLRDAGREFLKRVGNQHTFQPKLQVTRKGLDESIAKFLRSDKQVLIISGPSGIGKTCLLCQFAERNLDIESNSTLVLLLRADSLPPTDLSIDSIVGEALDVGPSMQEWVRKVRAALRNRTFPWQLVVIIDGADKHPSIRDLLQAIDRWARTIANDVSEVKLIAAYSPAGTDQIPELTLDRYFSPAREILAGARGAVRLPGLQVTPFTEQEAREAYEKYRAAEGLANSYDDLTNAARRVLAYPLFMRLVSEAYKNGKVPPNPISFQTLHKYCEHDIFCDRSRKRFVEKLVDTMLASKVRELSGSQMSAEPGLCDAYLAKHSPFHELLDSQVLSVHQRQTSVFPANLDEEYVEFSMDRIFQFLLIRRVLERYRGSADQFFESGLSETVDAARDYPSLRSGLVDLLAELVRNRQATDAQRQLAFSKVTAASGGGSDPWIADLLSDVLLALADEIVYPENNPAADSTGESQNEHDPFLLAAQLILDNLGEHATPLFSATVTALFVRALWGAAIVLLRLQAQSKDLGVEPRFRVQNQLAVVLKNQDEWGAAQQCSDENDVILPQIQDAGLRVRHWLNRFSVYYDLGDRQYALGLCEQANHVARGSKDLQYEEAATANNLGIAYVYFDRPADAERVLSEGVAAAADRAIVAGHNYLNLGLVRMVQWQLRGGAALAQGEADVAEACSRFQKEDYAQGILYGHATRGLIRLYEGVALKSSFAETPAEQRPLGEYDICLGKFREARELMERGLEMAREKGEDWPTYGIQADLALWHVWHPAPDLEHALAFATEAYDLVDSKKDAEGDDSDPEGKSIISMILARVLLDCEKNAEKVAGWNQKSIEDMDRLCGEITADADREKTEDLAPAPRLGAVQVLLQKAEQQFAALGFHSAAARAAAGLIEVAPLIRRDPREYEELREQHRGHLNPDEFPRDFAEKFEPMDWKLLFLTELF